MPYNGYSSSRVSKEELEFYDLKNKAAEFYRTNGVPQKIECVLNEMFYDKPDDIYGYLANYFTKLSAQAAISKLSGKEIYDARGQLAIQAEVFCILKMEEKRTSSATISSDCKILDESFQDPSGEVIKISKRTESVTAAIHWINKPLSAMLTGFNPCNQTGVDKILSDFFVARYLEDQDIRKQEKEKEPPKEPTPEPPTSQPAPAKDKKGEDKGKKGNSTDKAIPPEEPPEPVLPGSMAIGTVSLAVAKAGAQLQGLPLYKYIAALSSQECPKEFHIPVPLVTLLCCGKLSPGKLNLLEEVILIPKAGQKIKQIVRMVLELQNEMRRIVNATSKTGPVQIAVSDHGAFAVGFERPEQPLDLIAEACADLGLTLGTELHLAVNCAAHELMDYSKGKYDVIHGTPKSPDELVDMYEALSSKYPALVALIDPLRKEDVEQWERLSSVIGASCSLLSTAPSKPPGHGVQRDSPTPRRGVKGYLVQQTNEMTVSDLTRIASERQVILGSTCGEPCNEDSLSDLAVGLRVPYVRLGGLGRSERLTKYNRLISIEEELTQQGILDSERQHTSLLFVKTSEST
ncbi:enolase 4 [Aplochiton taeniatus]